MKLLMAICAASATVTYFVCNSLGEQLTWKLTNPRRFKTLDETTTNQSVLGYVVPCETMFNQWRRLGNQLFAVAAVLYAANVTGRRPTMPRRLWHNYVEKSFDVPDDDIDDVDYKRLPSPYPTVSIDHLSDVMTRPTVAINRTGVSNVTTSEMNEKVLMVCGYFQKYRFKLHMLLFVFIMSYFCSVGQKELRRVLY